MPPDKSEQYVKSGSASEIKEEDVKLLAQSAIEKVRKEIEDKIDKRENNVLQILAIFITLFTFISVNVSFFANINDVSSAAWFMLLMLFCSVSLVSFLFILIKTEPVSTKTWIGLSTGILALLALLLFGKQYVFTLENDSQIVFPQPSEQQDTSDNQHLDK